MSSGDSAVRSIESARVVGADPWLETRLDHPEDVAVLDETTLFAGGEGGQLYRVDLEDGRVTELASTGGFVLGVTVGPDGDLYACDFQQHAVLRLPLDGAAPAGDPETVVAGGPGDPPWHPNYCLFDAAGRLYVSDSGDRTNVAESGGCVYVVEPDGEGRVLTDALSAFPNGMALSADGARLFVAETGSHSVSVVHLEDGRATAVEPLDVDFGLVDGLAFDAEDALYAASIGDNAVYRYRDGAVETVLHDPDGLVLGNPTNLAFGGPDLQTMYVGNLALWHVTAVDLDRPGRYPVGHPNA